jgi:hypothetical protein
MQYFFSSCLPVLVPDIVLSIYVKYFIDFVINIFLYDKRKATA